MKVRRLNQKRAKDKLKKMAAVNKFFSKLILYHYYYLKSLQPLTTINTQEREFYI